MNHYLKVDRIFKSFNGKAAVNDVSFNISKGEIFSLLGASGSGKTTLLKIIAGLETTHTGKIIFNGNDLTRISPDRRGFGMMFQEFALFPHRNVYDNISFGLEIKKKQPGQIKHRVNEILHIVGLEGFGERKVNELSGGERQRVALARSLAPSPRLLMLDEPLGALDRALREKLLADLVDILKGLNMTTIFVTHDQVEAFAASDTVAVMRNGRLEQLSTPEDLYNNPANGYVANFLGYKNIMEGKISPESEVILDCGLMFNDSGIQVKQGEKVSILIRPDRAILIGKDELSSFNKNNQDMFFFTGKICSRIFQGKNYSIGIMIDSGAVLFFDIPNITPPPETCAAVTVGVNKNDGIVYL